MKKIFRLVANFLGFIAMQSLSSYSWIGMYEEKKPSILTNKNTSDQN